MFEWLADQNGIILRRDVAAVGIGDNALARARKAGHVHRLRQGAYVLSAVWNAAGTVERHRLLAAAVRRQYGEGVALSHTSANIVQGGPNWGLDLKAAHVTHLDDGGGRREAGVVHHGGICRVGDLTRDEAGWITTPTRTALDTAAIASLDPAVAVLEWFLNRGMTTQAELQVRFESMRNWGDTLHLQLALRLAGDRSESVGETRVKLLCRAEGLPAPIQQFDVVGPGGLFAGRVDFAWPQYRTIVEFDGREKYHRLRRPGETLEQMVMREKDREDLIRELTGWTVIRLTWVDLQRPAATAARIRRAFAMAA